VIKSLLLLPADQSLSNTLKDSAGNDYSGKVDTKTLIQTEWQSQKSGSEMAQKDFDTK